MRWQGQYFFLTFPQCNLDKNAVLRDLNTKLRPSHIRVANELHSDGSPHIHVWCRLPTRLRTSNPNFFDTLGFHPNIQSCRSWKASLRYVSKDGDFVSLPSHEEIDALLSEQTRGRRRTNDDRTMSREISQPGDCNMFSSEEEWLRDCIKHGTSFGYAARLWALNNKFEGNITLAIPDEGEYRLRIRDGMLRELRRPRDTGTTVLTGPTGIGKTSWAILYATKPCMTVTHIDDLRLYTDNIKSLIFDDMTFTHMPIQAQIHLVDNDIPRSIHCRYGVAHIPPNIQKIFTCNSYPFDDHSAIKRRIHYIKID